MTGAFDKRIVRVGIQIEKEFLVYEDLDIRLTGQKFAGPTSNNCTIKISNLTRDERNYILTKATPILPKGKKERTPIYVTVDVGRESYGTFRLFEGQCFASSVTQPPDIGIVLRSLTQNFATSVLNVNSQGSTTQLKMIAQSVADQCGLQLDFTKCKDRQIANYAFTGAVLRQIEQLQLVGDVRAFVDNKTLVVMDKNTYRGTNKFRIDSQAGMVGVPQPTESGASVQVLVTPSIQVGSGISLGSEINPAVNGSDYTVSAMTFDIANRDNPFFYTLSLSNLFLNNGTT